MPADVTEHATATHTPSPAVVRGRHTFASVTDKISSVVLGGRPTLGWYFGFGVLSIGMASMAPMLRNWARYSPPVLAVKRMCQRSIRSTRLSRRILPLSGPVPRSFPPSFPERSLPVPADDLGKRVRVTGADYAGEQVGVGRRGDVIADVVEGASEHGHGGPPGVHQ